MPALLRLAGLCTSSTENTNLFLSQPLDALKLSDQVENMSVISIKRIKKISSELPATGLMSILESTPFREHYQFLA
jgi:hypothetical protein